MNIESLAKICHQANKAYCESVEDFSIKNWEDAEDWQKESSINGVKYALDNSNITPEDLHKSWMKEKVENGWVYGDEKDSVKKTHPCLVDYSLLSNHHKAKDKLFHSIVNALRDSI